MATNLQILNDRLASQYPTSGVNFHVALVLDNRSTFTFTANASTDVITTSANHDFLTNMPITVSGANLPAPLTATGTYYARDITANTFKLALTAGGVAIDLTTAGTGVMTCSDVALNETYTDLSWWVRKEISSYQGVGNRQVFTPVAPTIDWVNKFVRIQQTVAFNNTSGSLGIVFDKALLIRGGSATRGNTTGLFDSYWAFSGSQTIAATENRGIIIPLELRNG
ncbi:hypothetical protein [Floridanema evergladense]|uniref:Uncharacterized protein n=1 Tax=Floridaenema evergladense BLCC-F167 TaxID=3153639 RepID=A0ABV4WD37_9CYAN